MYLALDIGGTKLMVAAFSSTYEILRRERADTPSSLSEGLELLQRMAHAVVGEDKVQAIGASAGGPLDHVAGVVSPLHMPTWREVPLRQIFEKEFDAPFAVDVDTNAAALAEYAFGGHNVDRLLYVTVSTGMGGGFVVDGELYRGTVGAHPEIGHQVVPYELPQQPVVECPCGARGCIEAVVSGRAIQRHYGRPAEELSEAEWCQVGSNLGQALRNATALYAPSVIALGGGVCIGGGEGFLNAVRDVLEQGVQIVPVPRVVLSGLGYDTALWGGLAMAVRAQKSVVGPV